MMSSSCATTTHIIVSTQTSKCQAFPNSSPSPLSEQPSPEPSISPKTTTHVPNRRTRSGISMVELHDIRKRLRLHHNKHNHPLSITNYRNCPTDRIHQLHYQTHLPTIMQPNAQSYRPQLSPTAQQILQFILTENLQTRQLEHLHIQSSQVSHPPIAHSNLVLHSRPIITRSNHHPTPYPLLHFLATVPHLTFLRHLPTPSHSQNYSTTPPVTSKFQAKKPSMFILQPTKTATIPG